MTIEQAKQTITNSTLPAEIKAQALENLERYYRRPNVIHENELCNAIMSFKWLATPQGAIFWNKIWTRAGRGEFDPPAESVEEIEKKLKEK